MDRSKYLDPARPVRRWITFGVGVGGALAGAAVGFVLTPLGKIVAEAPPADAANYLRNVIAFAALGAVLAPSVTWAALRHVPLWRTVTEPLAGAVAGAVIAVLVGSGTGLLLLTPLGAAAAAARLGYAHRPRAIERAG